VWVTGQLYIGGVGLAKGYWGDQQKTNASFIIHPDTGERIYRTGDLGRYLPNGAIEFLGREDAQVKVQGYRIELGEIETVLSHYQGINQVVVNTIGEDNKRLIAYLVAQTEIAPEKIRNWLSEKLPQYMIPSYFVFLDRLPLNSNGKINRKLLPEPKLETKPTPKLPESISPITAEVTSLVSQVLKVENLDIYVNMLELGANSVDIVRIANAIEHKFQIRLKLSELAQTSNLAALATAIEQKLPQLNDREWEEGSL
ncbi:MAG: phosphopantetheine-binding protein, partial [Pleurocapsa sp.]